MSTALTAASLTSLPTTQKKVNLDEFGGGGDFLGRLTLFASQSKQVAQGKIQGGHYGIPGPGESVTDLGETVDILPLAARVKAMDLSGEQPIACFDPESELFQDIKQRSGVKDSGCVYGPSFLVFERNSGKILEFYMGNGSGRYEAPKMGEFLPLNEQQAEALGVEAHGPLPCTLSAEFVERGRQAWYAPKITRCSTPINNLPPIEQIIAEVTKFVNEGSEEAAPEVAKETKRKR